MTHPPLPHSPLPWELDESVGSQIKQPAVSKRRRIVFPPDHDGIQDAAYALDACNRFPDIHAALVNLMVGAETVKGYWSDTLDNAMQAAEAALKGEVHALMAIGLDEKPTCQHYLARAIDDADELTLNLQAANKNAPLDVPAGGLLGLHLFPLIREASELAARVRSVFAAMRGER